MLALPKSFARLFSAFSTLEDAFGLSELGTVERAVFRFITEQVAADKIVVTSDVVASGLATRSSIYRHLDTLESRDLICRGLDGRRSELTLHPRLAGHQKIMAGQMKAVAWPSPNEATAPTSKRRRPSGAP